MTRRFAYNRLMGRGHVELVHAGDVESSAIPSNGWPAGATATVLSRDPDDGAFTGLLRLPVGYRRSPGTIGSATELLVLGGSVRIGDVVRTSGYYEYKPAGSGQEPWIVAEDCELLFKAAGDSTFTPDASAAAADGLCAWTPLVPTGWRPRFPGHRRGSR